MTHLAAVSVQNLAPSSSLAYFLPYSISNQWSNLVDFTSTYGFMACISVFVSILMATSQGQP